MNEPARRMYGSDGSEVTRQVEVNPSSLVLTAQSVQIVRRRSRPRRHRGPLAWCEWAPHPRPPGLREVGYARPTMARLESPHDRLLAVVDDPAAVPAILATLGGLGYGEDATEVLRGDRAADGLDAGGGRHGWLGRLTRALQFSLMDQLPDLAWYEAALRDGRVVISLRVAGLDRARAAATALERLGAHFGNHFGRFQTAALLPWRGAEPKVPRLMKR